MMEEMIPLIRIQVEEVRRGGGGRMSDADEEAEGEGSGGEGRRGELSAATSRDDDDDSSNNASSESKSPGQRLLSKLSPFSGRADDMRPGSRSSSSSRKSSAERDDVGESVSGSKRGRRWRHVQAVMAYYQALRKIKRTKSNQRWMKLRTTVQLSSAIQKKPPLKREDSFLKRFSTRQIPETQETVEDTGSEGATGEQPTSRRRRRRAVRAPRTVVNPDENFYFYWLWIITGCVLYNLWTLIVRQSFPELQIMCHYGWVACDGLSDAAFALDLLVQLRTGYLEQGLMVYDSRKLARHYLVSRAFLLDLFALTPLDLLQLRIGTNPIVRFPRFLKVYRAVSCYYMVESRTVYPNFWRVINLIHILLILAHWFGCFYYLLSEAEGFQGDWVYPHRPGDYATLTRKYLGSLYWSTLTLTTIGDLPTPETNADTLGTDGPKFLPRRGLKSRLLQFKSNKGYVFTIVSYLIGVFIFATIVGQVGNVITNRNANRLEFERLLDGAKTYMRHHKVPGGMKRRVLRWYDYSWSRGRIQGGGDINTALGLLPDKLKTELALHVNLSVLKKVTIFQECQPEFLHDLVLKMKAYIFTPGDSICRKGEVAREMFIIADGILEVISETGRVLTTMKAGDFFGEIGILNLDGLNKRTADVRSVGYSELFSLSREDVLAAMKDYPEAQEILQTLGRKRLQEARNCSRHHRAKGDTSPDRLGDDSAPKRIVHKIRSDVKGIRNALRSRSRATRRSAAGGDSLDLHGIGSAGGEVGGKGVLRRMPRVESDEYHGNSTEDAGPTAVVAATAGSSKEEKVISPIGAGLPLLARLKLLKERQDREEKAAKQRASASAVVSSGGAGAAGTAGCSTGAAAASEPEVIGAGLPLLQRLLLLKAKEEREKNQLSLASAHQPSSSETVSPSSLKSPLSPTVKTLSPIRKSSESSSPGGGGGGSGKLHSPTARSSRKNSSGSSDGAPRPKVSFKDKILQVQSDGTAVSQPLCRDRVPPPTTATSPADSVTSNLISIPHTVVNKIKSPAKAMGTTFRDKLKLLHGAPTPKELSETSATEKCKLPVIGDRTPAESVAVPKDRKEEALIKKPWNKLKKAAILGESKSQSKSSVESVSENKIEDENPAKETAVPPPTHVSTAELVNVDNNNFKVENNNVPTPAERPIISLTGPLEPVPEMTCDMLLSSPDKERRDSKDSTNDSETLAPRNSKNYVSIDDLSPEYGGLPFVKKLKILNERQKLAELERAIKTRSSSLDCTSSCEDLLGDTLTRSHSEGSTMGRRKCLRAHQATAAETLSGHESNETLERRTLKSILKKLSGDITPTDSPQRPASDLRRLIRAPTLEGYAVRHSKFAKSVTFNRHTLPSPPTSTAAPTPPDPDPLDSTSPPASASCSPPPESDLRADDSDVALVVDTSPVLEAQMVVTSPPLPPQTPFDFRPELDLQPHLDPMYGFNTKGIAALRPEEIRVPSEKPKLTLISAVANQRKLLRGSVEEQEYFSEVLLGIKQVIQGHLHDVQGKFQERFNSLENEVRKRDEIISQLQSRIQELERCGLAGLGPLAPPPPPLPPPPAEGEPLLPPPPPPRSSSGSDDYSAGELVFMRGDSLDTVFATSPPTPAEPSAAAEHELSDERLERLTAGLDLDAMSFAELQSLAESISRSRLRRGDSGDAAGGERSQFRLDTDTDSTYSRRRAAKLRQRKSWEEHSDQESMELYELTRPLSPHTMAEDRSLLSPEETSLRTGAGGAGRRSLHPFHLFGSHLDSTKSKIKKTLSVDTGMHQTGRKGPKFPSECEHRKFSLGSFFGYHRERAPAPAGAGALGSGRGTGRGGARRARANGTDVVLDISSDHSWSDSTSSSSSSDSDSVPRTPVFEEFMESRPHRASHATLASNLPGAGRAPESGGVDWEILVLTEELEKRMRERARHHYYDRILKCDVFTGSESDGADWEILMLAEELEKRERERARHHHYDRILKDLEEESDTPPTTLRGDSVDAEEAPPPPPPVPPRAASAATELAAADDCRQRASSVGKLGVGGGASLPGSGARAARGGGVILRAASLDRECSSPPAAATSGAGEVRATSAASPGSPARRSGSLEARRRL